jgi:hypothetical protein
LTWKREFGREMRSGYAGVSWVEERRYPVIGAIGRGSSALIETTSIRSDGDVTFLRVERETGL